MTLDIYAIGIAHASVCAPKTWSKERVVEEVNAQALHPTDSDLRWEVSTDPTFKGGEPNPCVCDDDPNRKHWLMVC